MATGAKAIERIAAATGLGLHAVSRTARALREAEADLWPKGAPGGGKGAAHVHTHHLVNLLVALVISQTHTEAPQTVATYRSLRPWFDQDERNPLPPNRDTFGGELDYIVEHIEDFEPDDRPDEPNRLAAVMLSRGALEVVLAYRGQPFALTIIRQGVQEATGFWTMPSPEQNIPEAAPLRSGKIPFALLKILAELWVDTRDRQGASPLSSSGSAPANVSARNENAALPGAAPRQPRANAANGLTDPWHSISARRERQPNARGPGFLGILSPGEPPYDPAHSSLQHAGETHW